MKNLLKYESRKLIRQKSFYICTAIMVAMSIISLLIYKLLVASFLPELLELVQYELTASYSMLTALSNASFTLIFGIFLALFVCSDFDMQTVKNIYARGYSKTQVYFAKYITGVIAVTISFILTLAISFLFGQIIFSQTGEFGQNYFLLILGQWVTVIANASFVFAICMLVKKTGGSIALSILGTSIISLVLSLIDAIIGSETFFLTDYWLDAFFAESISLDTELKRIWICIGGSVIYTALFTALGWLLNVKREI